MKATVDAELCTGCALCPDVSPDAFEMDGEVAKARLDSVPAGAEDDTREAAESCPVEAIEISE